MAGVGADVLLQGAGGLLDRLVQLVGIRFVAVLIVLTVGLVFAYVAGSVVQRLLVRLELPDVIEGTAFERTARDFDTSTIEILAWLTRYFVLGVAIFAALTLAGVDYIDRFWNLFIALLPQIFVAIVVLIIGIVVGDKVELMVAERLRGVKLPQVNILPLLAKLTVFFLAILVALSQIGVATLALIVLLAGYLAAVIVLSAVAFYDLLRSGAAGTYLLFTQPYSIGDEVIVDDVQGVVQELNLFVTHIESDGEEYILPNARVFRYGIGRVR